MTQLLGVRIANLRKQKKLSTKKLATGIISISYLSNIETCKKIPSLETLLFLADRLNVSHQQLVFEEVGNSDLETLFIDLFNCLVRNQMLEAKQKLDEIEHNYSIQMESPIAEGVVNARSGLAATGRSHGLSGPFRVGARSDTAGC